MQTRVEGKLGNYTLTNKIYDRYVNCYSINLYTIPWKGTGPSVKKLRYYTKDDSEFGAGKRRNEFVAQKMARGMACGMTY